MRPAGYSPRVMLRLARHLVSFLIVLAPVAVAAPAASAFLDEYCADCHDSDTKKGGLDLTALPWNLEERSSFDEWVKVFDLVSDGHMPPPKKKTRPDSATARAFLVKIGDALR